jgi:LuxR family maltose regulon positive regulatory protein
MIQQADALTAPDLPIFHWVKAVRVRLWLAQGNLAEAVHWAESSGLPLGPDFDYAGYPGEYATLVRVWLAQERFEEVQTLLERMQNAAQTGGRSGRLVEILMLKALALYAQGNLQAALIPLAQALSRGEAARYIRLFVDEGLPMAQLLHIAKTRQAVPNLAYVEQLLAAFPEPPRGAALSAGEASRELPGPHLEQISGKSSLSNLLIEPLSDRELEILHLVAAGLSNQDIAAQLVIAEGTVKKHLHNIFGKLDVRSRTQAIVRATELKLL